MRQRPIPTSQIVGVRRRSDSCSRTDVGDRVNAFLRQRHPHKTPDHVAVETGVPAGTVQKWLDRGSAPSVAHYCRLWLAYGPEFLAATIERAPAWLDAAHRAEEAARLKAEIAAREARLAKLGASA